jgi:hypothetical protein
MRMFVLAALAITAFAATMTIDGTDANAVVCARGVHRMGCVGAEWCCGRASSLPL